MTHKLNVDPSIPARRQKRRVLTSDRREAANEEISKLLNAGHIREVRYPTWLANPVLVKKPNGKWRMCIDFTDLNKACPKDSYPLPSIDELVDGASGNELLSMMDAHSGYNQILMHEPDEEKTSFITDSGTFCYRVMPFGLRNAGATFQRLMDKVFVDQIGRNVSAYVDDILVKSASVEKHPEDLRETLRTLKLELDVMFRGPDRA